MVKKINMEILPDATQIEPPNKALHSDSQKLRRSFLAMQLLAAGELGRYMPNPARTNQGNPTIG